MGNFLKSLGNKYLSSAPARLLKPQENYKTYSAAGKTHNLVHSKVGECSERTQYGFAQRLTCNKVCAGWESDWSSITAQFHRSLETKYSGMQNNGQNHVQN